MLLRAAELLDADFKPYQTDLRLQNGRISELGDLQPQADEVVIDIANGLVLPGLNDHHTHLVSFAASLNSVHCGPPEIIDETQLVEALWQKPDSGWLRGVGFHESVCPGLDKNWLDLHGPERPIRIQHRTGRLWILNSLGLDLIQGLADAMPDHERRRLADPDGKLYDVDELVSSLTRQEPPPIESASQILASFGVTGINDMTPANNQESLNWFKDLQSEGKLRQRVCMSGRPELSDSQPTKNIFIGSTKVHLHDTVLPDFGEFVDLIAASHKAARGVAVHCVTEVELVFTLSAFRAAGTVQGDRIEHASVVPPQLLQQLSELNLGVVTQPNFVREKGDSYIADIPASEHEYLYRCRSLKDRGIPTAFGTDLPFGRPDPWLAMLAATNRQTLNDSTLNATECITPEEALAGFIGALEAPFTPRTIKANAAADLCILDAPWQIVRNKLNTRHVRFTIIDGNVVYARD